MKIGILTHPLKSNYGGILQCYALNFYLEKKGHETIVLNRKTNKELFIKRWIRCILKFIYPAHYQKSNPIDTTINIRPFVRKHINQTDELDTNYKMKNVCCKYNLDTVIVGSDQVWRRDYAINFGYNYFLDFAPSQITKISYAASFGLSNWMYNQKETRVITKLLQEFKGISVREDDAILLLKNNTGIEAKHVLDPTLLLTSSDYSTITNERKINEKYIFVYWLGTKEDMNKVLNNKDNSDKRAVIVNLRDNIARISIEDWLSYIKYAEYIITDSFHGCAFSIIYNKQFKVYQNESGGNSRIYSLLKLLEIEQKLNDPKYIINYDIVNKNLDNLRIVSKEYLNNLLT